MSEYYSAAICLNGHCRSAYLTEPEHDDSFCTLCGAEIIAACPFCGSPIRGKVKAQGFVDPTAYKVPAYCYSCGRPYPWTQAALDAVVAILEEEEALSDEQRQKLQDSLPDVIAETPKSSLASSRIKNALGSVGRFTADALRQFAIDFGCELVKQQLGL